MITHHSSTAQKRMVAILNRQGESNHTQSLYFTLHILFILGHKKNDWPVVKELMHFLINYKIRSRALSNLSECYRAGAA